MTGRAAAALALALAGPAAARGQAPDPDAPAPTGPVDVTRRPGADDEPRRLRATVETGFFLGAEFAGYLLKPSPSAAAGRGRVSPLDKLFHGAVSLDANSLRTNFAGHPAMGVALYQIARANRLPAWEAALWSAAGSGLWELSEHLENASINDLLVTPAAGIALGEPLHQLAAHLDRAPQGPFSPLAWALSPLSRLHDLLDRRRPARGDPGDVLTPRLAAGGGLARGGGRTRGLLTLDAGWELVGDPAWGAPGRGVRALLDGQVSGLAAAATFSGARSEDLRLQSWTLLAAVHARDAGEAGGLDLLAGAGVAFDVRMHRWIADGPDDLVALVHVPSLRATGRARLQGGRLALRLGAGLGFGGARSFALDGAPASAPPSERLPTVQRGYGYHFGLGPALSCALEVRFGPIAASASARWDRLWPVDRPDPTANAGPFVRLEERWSEASAGLSLTAWRLEVGATAAWRGRWSRAGGALREASERSLGLWVGPAP